MKSKFSKYIIPNIYKNFILPQLNKCVHCNIQIKFFRYIKSHFEQADKNSDGNLSLEECMKIAKQLNIKMGQEDIERRFRVRTYPVDKLFSKFVMNLLKYSVSLFFNILGSPFETRAVLSGGEIQTQKLYGYIEV